jgi:hypothetical protein
MLKRKTMIRVLGYTVYNGITKSYKVDLTFTEHGLAQFKNNLKYAYKNAVSYLTTTENMECSNWYKARVSDKKERQVSSIQIGGLKL